MRYKTFNATGIAPDGRLYAGDLNGIQDLYLPLSDFTSTVDVGTLRVGDPTLQLYKYGAGEFRMSGAMRFDGIMRGLGGLVAGAFTTTQRNAIAAGFRPYGLVILNTTTNTYEWNKGTDAVPVWETLGGAFPAPHASTHLPGGSDPINFATAVNMAGTRAAKPAASASNLGLLYFETDWNQIWRSTGAAWVRFAMYGRKVNPSDISGLSAIDGDEITVNIGSGVDWSMRYNSGGGSYKWEFLGGSSLFDEEDDPGVASSSTYTDLGGPSITLPRPGEYDVETGFKGFQGSSGEKLWRMSYSIGGSAATDDDAVSAAADNDTDTAGSAMRVRRKEFSSAVTLAGKFRKESASVAGHISDAWMRVTPVHVS